MRDKPKCPVCGDPGPFILWVSKEPPIECPYTPAARNVTECAYQMKKAEQRALFRKVAPDCFDANGNLKPDRSIVEVLEKLPPGMELIL